MNNAISPQDVRRLMQDATFKAILDKVRNDQCTVFLHSNTQDVEMREEAHTIIRATFKIEQALQAILTEEVMQERKQRK